MGEGSGKGAVRKCLDFWPRNGAFCVHFDTWLDSSKNFRQGKQIISVSIFKIISITVSVSFLRDHFYIYIVSVLKIFSVLVSVWVLLISIISVSVWVSVTGISLTEGYRTPTFKDEKVKNLLSPAVNRGDLRRLNYNKTVFDQGSTIGPVGELTTLSQTPE